MRKGFFLLAVLVAAGAAEASAQEVTARIAGLEGNAEYMEMLREEASLQAREDSVTMVVNRVRRQLRDDPAQRAVYSAEILRCEEQLFSIRTERGRLTDRINTVEQDWVLANLDLSSPSTTPAGRAAGTPLPDSLQTADLVHNAYFREQLPQADYRALLSAQRRERTAFDLAAACAANYEAIEELKISYDTITAETPAAVLYERYRTLQSLNRSLCDSLQRVWSAVYDNKNYAYAYVLDRLGRDDLLAKTEEQLAGVRQQMADTYNYYSFPEVPDVYPVYLLLYGAVMPVLAAVIVNWLVIRKKLAQPALKLMRKEQKQGRFGRMDLGDLAFVPRFCIRQFLRELRTGLTVIFGLFVSLLICMLSLDCYVMCSNVGIENRADTKFEYMYTYKYPTEKAPSGGEEAYAKTLKRERFGYNLDVTVLGITKDNSFFDADVKKGKSRVILSSAAAQKFDLAKGDQFVLKDEDEERDYAFTVDGVTQYSTGLYVFMDIDSMRELFDEGDDYYNVVFADHKLNIPSGRLYGTLKKSEVEKNSDIFVDMMIPMVSTLMIMSALIFCVVMYLMMKVMIDRSSFGISLVKIFGYRISEIRKLYLNSNFCIVAVGALICIPLSKLCMDAMYPLMVSNIACGMNLHFPPVLYIGLYVGILLLYAVINFFLVRRLQKITPAEVLKNRE